MKIVQKKFKVHSITGRITPEGMLKAFKAVKKNWGSAGLDKVTVQLYEKKSRRKPEQPYERPQNPML